MELDQYLNIDLPNQDQEEQPRQVQLAVKQEQIISHLKNDPDTLAALAMPEVFEYGWPPVFLSIWTWLLSIVHKQRDFSKLAIGLPRGFGKTTLVKLFLLYCILFTKKQFILILSATEGHAINIISDVMDMLNEPNIVKLFGLWKVGAEIDKQNLKKFSFRGRNIIIAGIGAGGSVRGLNLKNARPDVMVFEDVQSREDADSETVSTNLEKWMQGTAMKAKSPKGCLTLFIANMYPTPHSILKKLVSNSTWIKWIAGGILQDPQTGKLSSLWEELQPLSQLLEEYKSDFESGHPEIFYAEVLNDPNASVNNRIDISKVPLFPYDDYTTHQGNYIIIDPATGKTNGDDVSIGYYEVFQGKPALMELEFGKFSPGENVWKTLDMCSRRGCALIFVEGNAYQATLAYWFKFIMAQVGIEGIEVVPIYSGKAAKNSRILDMFKQLVKGEILLHDSVRNSVFQQVTAFAPLRTDNTDGILDLLTYAPRILSEYEDLIARQTIIENQIFQAIPIDTNPQTNSPI